MPLNTGYKIFSPLCNNSVIRNLYFFILEERGWYEIIADHNSSTILFNFFGAVHNLSLKKTKLGTREYFCVCRMIRYGLMTLISVDIDLLLPHLHTTPASLPHSIIFAKKFLLLLIRFLRFILPLICSLSSQAPFYKCRSPIMDSQNSHYSNLFPRPILCGDIFLTEFCLAFVKHDRTIHHQ